MTDAGVRTKSRPLSDTDALMLSHHEIVRLAEQWTGL